MTYARSTGYVVVEVPSGGEAFASLQKGAADAVAGKTAGILIDLSAVQTVDGAMVAVLAGLARQLGPGRDVVVVAQPEVARYFSEWRLDSVWPTYSDRGVALADLAG